MYKASICIPAYNGDKFIAQAIQSVLDQTVKDFHLIIVNDASTDDTLKISQSFTDPRITIFQNPTHLGLVGNWNKCLELASSQYIQIFHQDDLMMPTTLECLVDFLNAHPEAGFVFSNIITIDAQGTYLRGHWNPRVLPDQDTVFMKNDLFEALLQYENFIPCQTVMLRRELIHNAGKFDDRLRYTPDLEMWMRLALYADVGYINEPLIYLRCHERQESRAYLGKANEIEEVWRAIQIIFTEQRTHIPEPDRLYHIALSSLINWSWFLVKTDIRRLHYRTAWSSLRLNVRLRRLYKAGLNCIPPLPDLALIGNE